MGCLSNISNIENLACQEFTVYVLVGLDSHIEVNLKIPLLPRANNSYRSHFKDNSYLRSYSDL